MPRKTNNTPAPAVEQTTPQAAEPVNQAATEGPQLTLADVKNAVNVIDYAANQGAFKGWEVIAQVMQVRQRLAAFVEAATPKVEGEQADQAEQAAPANEAAN